MNYYTYILKSVLIFFIIFTIGLHVNKFFEKFQKRNANVHPIIIGMIHLLCIINIAYVIHGNGFAKYFEVYTPNIMFSSFLLSLQTSMISNLKTLILNDTV